MVSSSQSTTSDVFGNPLEDFDIWSEGEPKKAAPTTSSAVTASSSKQGDEHTVHTDITEGMSSVEHTISTAADSEGPRLSQRRCSRRLSGAHRSSSLLRSSRVTPNKSGSVSHSGETESSRSSRDLSPPSHKPNKSNITSEDDDVSPTKESSSSSSPNQSIRQKRRGSGSGRSASGRSSSQTRIISSRKEASIRDLIQQHNAAAKSNEDDDPATEEKMDGKSLASHSVVRKTGIISKSVVRVGPRSPKTRHKTISSSNSVGVNGESVSSGQGLMKSRDLRDSLTRSDSKVSVSVLPVPTRRLSRAIHQPNNAMVENGILQAGPPTRSRSLSRPRENKKLAEGDLPATLTRTNSKLQQQQQQPMHPPVAMAPMRGRRNSLCMMNPQRNREPSMGSPPPPNRSRSLSRMARSFSRSSRSLTRAAGQDAISKEEQLDDLPRPLTRSNSRIKNRQESTALASLKSKSKRKSKSVNETVEMEEGDVVSSPSARSSSISQGSRSISRSKSYEENIKELRNALARGNSKATLSSPNNSSDGRKSSRYIHQMENDVASPISPRSRSASRSSRRLSRSKSHEEGIQELQDVLARGNSKTTDSTRSSSRSRRVRKDAKHNAENDVTSPVPSRSRSNSRSSRKIASRSVTATDSTTSQDDTSQAVGSSGWRREPRPQRSTTKGKSRSIPSTQSGLKTKRKSKSVNHSVDLEELDRARNLPPKSPSFHKQQVQHRERRGLKRDVTDNGELLPPLLPTRLLQDDGEDPVPSADNDVSSPDAKPAVRRGISRTSSSDSHHQHQLGRPQSQTEKGPPPLRRESSIRREGWDEQSIKRSMSFRRITGVDGL